MAPLIFLRRIHQWRKWVRVRNSHSAQNNGCLFKRGRRYNEQPFLFRRFLVINLWKVFHPARDPTSVRSSWRISCRPSIPRARPLRGAGQRLRTRARRRQSGLRFTWTTRLLMMPHWVRRCTPTSVILARKTLSNCTNWCFCVSGCMTIDDKSAIRCKLILITTYF